MCPPIETAHTVDDYPLYYDPLYFPDLHPSIFDNPHNCCHWLASALNDHHLHCRRCGVYTDVCVFYDGMLIAVTCSGRSVFLSLESLENTSYQHCMVFSKIAQRPPLNVSDFLPLKAFDFPPWFYYSSDLVHQQLMSMPLQLLKQSARGAGIRQLCNKKICVDALRSHIIATKQQLMPLSKSALYERISTMVCQPLSSHSLLSLLCFYFDHVYGPSIAASLRSCHVFIWSSRSLKPFQPTFSWIDSTIPVLTKQLHAFTIGMLTNIIQSLPLYTTRPSINRYSRIKTVQGLLSHIVNRARFLVSVGSSVVSDIYLSYFPSELNTSHCDEDYILQILHREYGKELCDALSNGLPQYKPNQKCLRREKRVKDIAAVQERSLQLQTKWPSVVPEDTILSCLRRYYEGSIWRMPPTCAVCSQQLVDVQPSVLTKNGPLLERLQSLHAEGRFIPCKCIVPCMSRAFMFDSPLIDNLMLDKSGLIDIHPDSVKINLCGNCRTVLGNLKSEKVPQFALANHLYRGDLPEYFADLTWVEEKVCAKYCLTAHVTRLFHSNDPAQPRIFHGNTCSHDMNVVSTASVLPRTPCDVNGFISVVFLGPRPIKPEQLGPIFRVRKHKIWAFLLWLVNHNRLYADIVLDRDILELYPNDGPLPDVSKRVIHDDESDPNKIFHEETAGFHSHPASLLHESDELQSQHTNNTNESGVFMIEKMGVSDPECDKLSGRTFVASALKNLCKSSSQDKPDLIMYRGSDAINEYNNPNLIPGCFPTLFPFGIGGFEIKERSVPLSFQQQAAYYLKIRHRSFRYHNSFLFVCMNIMQRRQAHLHTHFTVRKSDFSKVAQGLASVSSMVLNNLATRLENEGCLSDLSTEEKNAMNLLKHVNTIAARIPGSHASKIFVRNEIRNYFGYFGLPVLFFTFNPCAAHSPIFQVMYGDVSIDLTSHFPKLVSARQHAICLAHDPVAAADFYEFSFRCCFEYLLGWDFKKGKSTDEGGIFGCLWAFYGSSELTERGGLHGHFLLWLVGALNPSDIHKHLVDVDYQNCLFSFLDDIIWHNLPDIDVAIDKNFEPCIQCPPCPPALDAPLHVIQEWESAFMTEIKRCGESLQ